MATSKKIKKVETPIDQRETFVSIQKNFADSDIVVADKLKTLYELQQADSEIDKILQLRGELPAEVEALEAEIASATAQADEANAAIEAYNKAITDNKDKIVSCDELISNYQKQLENIANSREYDSINKEIENQGYERLIAEKNISEAKMKIAEARAAIEDIETRLAIRQEDLKIKQEELAGTVEATAPEEEKLLAKREACAAKIDERTMSAYEHIRQSARNHLAVVTVFNGDACGGCFNTIIPQRLLEIASNKKLIICEHCGRILVNPDFE